MSLIQRLTLLLCLFTAVAVSVPSPAPRPSRVPANVRPSRTKRDDDPDPTICGDIIDIVNNGSEVFFASDAYDCLTSVPFNAAVALRFIDYYNTTMQFQSTLSFLRTPPHGYQQPAVDVVQGLELIKQNVTAGVYKNQYVFEADVQSLVYRMHDAHVGLSAGILSSFIFASPYALMTASVDGKQTPQIYLEDDVVSNVGAPEGAISPVVSINGEDAVEYIKRLAALNVVGFLEPHADWNSMMGSPVQDIQGLFDTFSGSLTFYPGDELNFTFANGSSLETYFLAVYTNPFFTGPLTTGGDYFNYFVLGLLPASYDEVEVPPAFEFSSTAPDAVTPENPSNVSAAYPANPDVVQENWAISGGGVVTGYFLNDTSTGVLSIPSFTEFGDDIGNFADAVQQFIINAREANLSKVIIDLQQNSGGLVELAFVTFAQFFPGVTPFAGSRRRSHELANLLGETFTSQFQSLLTDNVAEAADLETSEWVITDRLNADTGRNFSSWAEYFGPLTYNGDFFSLIERYDLANEIFDEETFDGWVPTAFTADAPKPTPPTPWAAENIVLLTDGTCSSACTLFMEMMIEKGVRTIAVGGQPVAGPMQAGSGTRGAAPYDVGSLDSDFATASNQSAAAAAGLPQVRDSGVFVNFATFNLRDQVRPGNASAVPLQFTYLPANCRLYFTLANVFNMSRLWRDVGEAAWGADGGSMCVAGSTGFTATVSTEADGWNETETVNLVLAPSAAADAVVPSLDYALEAPGSTADGDVVDAAPLQDGKNVGGSTRFAAVIKCDPTVPNFCGTQFCEPVKLKCGDGRPLSTHLCVPPCNNGGGFCPAQGTQSLVCDFRSASESSQTTFGVSKKRASTKISDPIRKGVCVPLVGTKSLGCAV